MNDKQAATIAIYQTPGTNALDVADQIKTTDSGTFSEVSR